MVSKFFEKFLRVFTAVKEAYPSHPNTDPLDNTTNGQPDQYSYGPRIIKRRVVHIWHALLSPVTNMHALLPPNNRSYLSSL